MSLEGAREMNKLSNDGLRRSDLRTTDVDNQFAPAEDKILRQMHGLDPAAEAWLDISTALNFEV
ncbi:MAG: hypothetical protein E6K12_09845 [Methanobacteriota archaeon]|nr:MAG: hypothetical protein E6K12_09845 [Euryarchaeota archaeon]